jgi:anti-anti-sigma factor
VIPTPRSFAEVFATEVWEAGSMWDDTYLPEGQGFDIEVRRSEDGTLAVVAVSGALDLSASPSLSDALDEETDREPKTLVVDLTAVTILSSPGIAVLLRAHRRIGKTRLCLLVDTDHVYRPLELLGVTDVIPVFRQIEHAVAGRDRPDTQD